MATEGDSPDDVRRKRRRFAMAVVAGALVLLAIRMIESSGCHGTPRDAVKFPPDPSLPGWFL